MIIPQRFLTSVQIAPIKGRDPRTGEIAVGDWTTYKARTEQSSETSYSDTGAVTQTGAVLYVDLHDRDPLPSHVVVNIDGREAESVSVANHRFTGGNLVYAEVRI